VTSPFRLAALTLLTVAGILLSSITSPVRPTASGSPAPSPAASTVQSPAPSPDTTPDPTVGPTATPSPTTSPDRPSLTDLLARLEVRGEAEAATYDRVRFRHWIDADQDGCDARAEVLIAEAVRAPAIGAGCALTGGRWQSAYDGLETTNPGSFDVDHVVPLKEAWVSGASDWTDDRRRAYANDLAAPSALIAVSATSNRSKADQDPAEWLPPLESYHCTYIADWIVTKLRWGLAIDLREYTTLFAYARTCPAPALAVVPAP
jgi:hypothetical protein